MTESEENSIEEFMGKTGECLVTLTKIQDDHERRIRRLEQYICLAIGAFGALKYLYDFYITIPH